MKPIEIHIEGYKIVISEEKQEETIVNKDENIIKYVPYPTIPTTPVLAKYPYATWTDSTQTIRMSSTGEYEIINTGGRIKCDEPHIIGE